MMLRFKRLIACGLALAAVATAQADNAAVQSALNTLYPGQEWEASDVGDATGKVKSGLVDGSIRTHPTGDAKSNKPAKLTRTLTIVSANAELYLKVHSYQDGSTTRDWWLKVFVNSEQIASEKIKSAVSIEKRYSLAKYAGQEVTLQLQNCDGGDSTWYWECAYWDLIEIRGNVESSAYWTGAIDNDVAKPGNWKDNLVPDETTAVYFEGNIAPNIPAGAAFAAKSVIVDATLTGDCDWSGVNAPVSGKIDLKGRKFTFTRLSDACTITDSSTAGAGGELHVTCASAVTKASVMAITGSLTLVKDGAGTLTWGGGTLAATIPILITNGVFKMGVNTANVFGNSGTIIVKGKGQFDLNYTGTADSCILNKTFAIEGDGPDGSGALVNSPTSTSAGRYFSSVILTGDATIGGNTVANFRGNGCGVSGPDYVLTIKNTRYAAFCAGNVHLNVRRVVCDGGAFQPCSDATSPFNQIPEGVFLKNGGILTPWSNIANYELPFKVTVEAGETGYVRCDGNSSKITGAVTVEAGATLAISSGKAFTFAGVVNNSGTISASVSTTITGTLRGNGKITGNGIAFGADSIWHVECNDAGFTEKANLDAAQANFLVGLEKVDVLCGGSEAEKTHVLAPKGNLTQAQVDNIALTVTDATSGMPLGASSLAISGGRLVLNVVRDQRPVIAVWTGAAGDGALDNAANWACTNSAGQATSGAYGVPCEVSDVYLNGRIALQFPAGTAFKAKSIVAGATLTNDCDWSGLTAPVAGTINLNGRKLTVSALKGVGEVTDTSGTGYQLLSFIQSTGTQYIDTGYTHASNTKIECEVDVSSSQLQTWTAIFGARKNTKDYNAFCFFATCSTSSYACYNRSGNEMREGVYPKDVKSVLTCLGKTASWEPEDGTKTSITTTGNDDGGVNTMFVFNVNTGDAGAKKADTSGIKMKLYTFKIYEGETLVHNFVPARRMTDGKVGLLDRASNEFHPDGNGGNFEAGLVTNAVSCGELHVKVAENQTVDNTDVALTGSLKLVKEGAGAFVAHRKGQTYFGGTQVAGGQFALWNSGKDATDWIPDVHGTMGDIGSTIDVESGARFNIVGNYNCCHFNFRLNGGQLESSDRPISGVSGGDAFAQTKPDWWGLGNTTLTADSKYNVRYNMLHNRDVVDLGGHTLDMKFTNDKTLHWGSSIRNGTLVVHNSETSDTGKSYFRTIAAVDARTVTFDMYEQFKLDNELSVSNYVSHSRNDLTTGHSGTAALNVYGTFKPVTDFFYGCTMQNGSTLDLSTRTGVWSTTSKSTTGKTAVEFAKGATVYVDLGARGDSGDKGKIVSWTAKPEGVTFKEAPSLKGKGMIRVESDGIYITRGLTIYIR